MHISKRVLFQIYTHTLNNISKILARFSTILWQKFYKLITYCEYPSEICSFMPLFISYALDFMQLIVWSAQQKEAEKKPSQRESFSVKYLQAYFALGCKCLVFIISNWKSKEMEGRKMQLPKLIRTTCKHPVGDNIFIIHWTTSPKLFHKYIPKPGSLCCI